MNMIARPRLIRRALLAGAGVLAAGTLAAATMPRKPAPPEVAVVRRVADAALPQLTSVLPSAAPAVPADVAFTDADGATHHLADYAGRTVVLNLWATWCGPCVEELPALAALARRAEADGIVVLALSTDRGGAPVVRRFLAAHGIAGLPVLLDAKGEAARAWGARGLPTTLILDRDGRERARVEGAADWGSDTAVATIRQLTAGAVTN
jgi:thiol-disulfide isomerase/thioredoxin